MESPMADETAPATKADIAELRSELHCSVDQLRDRMENLETRLEEAIHDSQTELLKAFYGFTETVKHRFDGQEDADANLKKRVATLESRILEVERRLNTPPAA